MPEELAGWLLIVRASSGGCWVLKLHTCQLLHELTSLHGSTQHTFVRQKHTHYRPTVTQMLYSMCIMLLNNPLTLH